METYKLKYAKPYGNVTIDVPKPKCYLRWGDEYGTIFSIYRDFNWFQKKMLKWCFGLEYMKDNK